MLRLLERLWRSLPAAGLIPGMLFMAVSLTPSLIPRNYVTQGILAGIAFSVGYAMGVGGWWLWRYMELPFFRGRALRGIRCGLLIGGLGIVVVFLWNTVLWQNSIRSLMGLEPLTVMHPLRALPVMLITSGILLAFVRLVHFVFRIIFSWMNRFIPRRISKVAGLLVTIMLFWSLIDGLLLRFLLRAADSSYEQLDGFFEPDIEKPSDSLMTGSDASLIRWEQLGRRGREFIASTPSLVDLRGFSEKADLTPIRVYAGIRSAKTAQERARLALRELQRVGGFNRSVLVLITPTGTGWVDPPGISTLEFLHEGDVASVAVQYSYLSSPLALFVEPDYGAETARALFEEVYNYWTTLPKDTRPRLYVYGLSLGAVNAEKSMELFEVLADPCQGALFVGPPFICKQWQTFTRGRNPGSPAWLPKFRDGSFVRFMNQGGTNVPDGAKWGPMRVVYLQNASDPTTFFEPACIYRELDWMKFPRGPDVSSKLHWYPAVTFLQLCVDILVAGTPPEGFGHNFSAGEYIHAWVEVTGVEGWTEEKTKQLEQYFKKTGIGKKT